MRAALRAVIFVWDVAQASLGLKDVSQTEVLRVEVGG